MPSPPVLRSASLEYGSPANYSTMDFNYSITDSPQLITPLISFTCQSAFIYSPHSAFSERYYTQLAVTKAARFTESYHVLYFDSALIQL